MYGLEPVVGVMFCIFWYSSESTKREDTFLSVAITTPFLAERYIPFHGHSEEIQSLPWVHRRQHVQRMRVGYPPLMPRAIFPCCTRARAYSICISLPVLLNVVKEKFMSPISSLYLNQRSTSTDECVSYGKLISLRLTQLWRVLKRINANGTDCTLRKQSLYSTL